MSFDKNESWEDWFFIGFTKSPLTEIEYKPETIQTILNIAEIQAVVAGTGGATIENLINKKGTTVWHILYAFAMVNDKEGLELVSQGKTQLFVPRASYQHTEVVWPVEVLNKYKIHSNDWQPFIIPFLVYGSSSKPKQFENVLSSKDGNRNLFGVFHFDQSNPENIFSIAEHFSNVLQNHE